MASNIFIRRLSSPICIFSQRNCRTLGLIPSFANFRLKSSSSKRDSNNEAIGTSTILLQDGLYIQELPIIVRQTNDVVSIFRNKNGPPRADDSLSNKPNDITDHEETAVVEGLHRCQSPSELYRILEVIPQAEVTPTVAANALHRLCSLNFSTFPVLDVPDTSFTGSAILGRLCDTVCQSHQPDVLLLGLKAALGSNGTGAVPQDYCQQLLNQCLLRVAENRFPLESICSLIMLLHSVGDTQNLEKLWSGLREQSSSIDENKMTKVFSILPLLKASRRVVLNILEQRVYACWWKLTPQGVLAILNGLWKIDYAPKRLCRSLTKWMSLNVHALTESQLCDMVELFRKLDHHDEDIQKTLERYMKARVTHIQDGNLVVQVAKYCVHFRCRSETILEAVCANFAAKCNTWGPQHVTQVIKAVGTLNWEPTDTVKFFNSLEQVLEARFVEFHPQDVVEMLLCCTYIGRFPLNFVRKVFNTYFLARLNSIQNKVVLINARASLHLLDAAMTMECPSYKGPLLPKNTSAKSVVKDSRLMRMHLDLHNTFAQILGGHHKFSTCTTAPRVPFAEIYLIDFEILANTLGSDVQLDEMSKNDRKAVIIHLPEHYCMDRKYLIGPQAARIRHLRLLGYNVIQLDFDTLVRLRSQPSQLLEYIKNKLLTHPNI